MPKQITKYDLLISCPSDVQTELNIIKEVVEEFNRTVGEANNAMIVTKHWSTDSYPESGGKAQELLNKQFVLQCDAAVAVFWTRFGTPTDNYGSGTEEEIEELIKNGKQVFLYFSDCSINPSSLDPEQYKKIQEFRSKYEEGKGIYAGYSDLSIFRKNFSNHLYQYFLKLFLTDNEIVDTNTISSDLTIKGISKGSVIDKPIIFNTNFKESPFIGNLKNEIHQLFEKVKDIYIPENIEQDEEIESEIINTENNTLTAKLGKMALEINQTAKLGKWLESTEITFSENEKKIIIDFANENKLPIDEKRFFNIGDLTEVKQPYGGGLMGTSQSTVLEGTEDEKEKYNLIVDLMIKITEFYQWKEYFQKLDSNYYIELAVTNNGTKFDEDVDVKLFVKENCLVTNDNLPLPGNEILEVAEKLFDRIYRTEKTVSINEYEDYLEYEPIKLNNVPLYGPTYEEKVESNKIEYKSTVDKTFCYEYFQEDGFDVICFNISYIKQNTNIAFPSLLIFNSMIDEIKYEIRSKYSPRLIKGILKIE